MDLGAVFLQQEVDAEHEDEEGEDADDQPHADDHRGHDREEKCGFAIVGTVTGRFIAVFLKVAFHLRIARSVEHHDQARRGFGRSLGEFRIGPLHEFLRHGYGVETRGKAYNAGVDPLLTAVAAEREFQRHHADHFF